LGQATGLQERIGDHGQERVSVQACPGAALEVVEPEFFLELLVRLLANPSGLDGGRKLLERSVGGQVGQVVLALAGRALLPHDPHLLAGQVLRSHVVDPLRRSIGYADTQRGKTGR
jgi:hypothetical protein